MEDKRRSNSSFVSSLSGSSIHVSFISNPFPGERVDRYCCQQAVNKENVNCSPELLETQDGNHEVSVSS